MTKIDIFSGFLGAGKTTLIKKLIEEGYKGEKLVLIENEFGEIGIDGGFLKEAGVTINEMNSGCICCSLVGDFDAALKQVLHDYTPDRILIEPSGVGKLSDVMKAVENVDAHDLLLNSYTAVVDVKRCKMYMKNFGEFFIDQVKHAKCIVLSHTEGVKEEKVEEVVALLREHNHDAVISTTPWNELSGETLLAAMEGASSLEHTLEELKHEHHHNHAHSEHCTCGCHNHEHHEHDHDEHCDCHEHHHEHDHEHCHEHEHHKHDHEHCHEHDHEHCHEHDHEHCHEHDHEHCHEHDHAHDEHCTCGCHSHEHHGHHHHHADEVFQSFGAETTKAFTEEKLNTVLASLSNEEAYGTVLRAKGIVKGENGNWIHFDYVPGAPDVRIGTADIIGRICVIGANLNEANVKALFEL